MNNLINVGVVGCGEPDLIRSFRSLPGCNLKMICDASVPRLNSLAALFPEVVADTKFKHMLNGIGLDAVVMATPVNLHFAMAKAAMLAGKHVMIKKPMAASAAECEELIEIARQKGLVLMVGHTFLYSPAVRKIKEIIDGGDLGQIRHICARHLAPSLCPKDANVAWDLASHDISIILHLLQQFPQSVSCCGSAHLTPGIEDVTSMTLNFGNDCSALVHSSWLEPRKVREMTIIGSKQMIVYDDLALAEKVRIYDTRVERPAHCDTLPEFKYTYHCGAISSPHLKQEEPIHAECLHFLECIQESKRPLTCGDRGLELVKILEASSASLKLRGGTIPLALSEATPLAKTHPHDRRARVAAVLELEESLFPPLLPNRAHELAGAAKPATLSRW
jgi:predicted dehydrogenase